MRRWACLILALLLPCGAIAQDVTVRSGEHADFSRLVLDFDASAGWALGRVDGGWEFRARAARPRFDLRRVYDLIPRKRIAAVAMPEPGVLRLKVDCDCHVDGFELRRGRIVIDVKDGPAPPGNPFDARLDAPAAPAVPADPPAVDPDLAAGLGAAIEDAARSVPVPSRGVGLPTPAALEAQSERKREFQAGLLEQMARAGSQGLIVPAPRPAPVPVPEAPPEEPPRPAPPAATLVPEHADQVAIETAVDRDAPDAAAARTRLTDDGRICPPPRLTDLPSWGRLDHGRPDLGKARGALAGEFDRIDPDRALALARFYVFLTFGAEARDVLRFADADAPETAAAMAMAGIVDRDGQAPLAEVLDGFETCDSAAALWAVLAGPPLARGQPVAENAVLRAFGDLPPHAQALLGPRLISQFGDAGLVETAARLRNAMTPADGAATVDAAVAGARLDAAQGQPEKAERELGTALAEHDPDSAEALLALAEIRLKAGEVPDPAQVAALEAMAFERRGSELAIRIDRVLAETLLRQGAFEAAQDLIVSRLEPATSPEATAMLRRLYAAAAAKAGPADFLRLVLPELVLPEPAVLGRTADDMPARRAVAERLLALGFAEDALAVLGPAAATSEDRDARLVGARAQLLLGRPAAAIAALATLDGVEAVKLRARAQEARGDAERARELYDAAGLVTDAARMALQQGDWAGLARAADPALRGLAERMVVAPPEGGETYDAANRLLSESDRDRAAISGLLAPH